MAQSGISVIDQGLPTLTGFLKSDLGLSAGAAGFAVSTFVLGRVFASYGVGLAADRLGERRVLVAGAAASGLLVALAGSVGVPALFVIIALAGAGSAVATPAGGRLVLLAFPRHRHGLALGIRQTGVPIGGLIGAALLPWIAHLYSWRWSLVFAGALAVAGALPLLLVRDREVAKRPSHRARPADAPWRDRTIWLLTIWGSLFGTGQYALLAFFALDLHQRAGIALTTGSLFLAVAQLGGLFGRVGWGVVFDRFRRYGRKALMLVVSACGLGSALALLELPPSSPRWALAAVMAFVGLGIMGFQGLFMTLLTEAAGPDRVGAASGMAVTAFQLATVAATPCFGFVADVSGTYRSVWVALTLVLLVASVPALFVSERDDLPVAL